MSNNGSNNDSNIGGPNRAAFDPGVCEVCNLDVVLMEMPWPLVVPDDPTPWVTPPDAIEEARWALAGMEDFSAERRRSTDCSADESEAREALIAARRRRVELLTHEWPDTGSALVALETNNRELTSAQAAVEAHEWARWRVFEEKLEQEFEREERERSK